MKKRTLLLPFSILYMEKFWQTAQRKLNYGEKTLVMAILNCTPDSFSDGGNFFSIETALRQAEKLIEEGADIIDIGGESTRPNAERVSTAEEMHRVVPVVKAVAKRFDVPISVDTSKAEVAEKSIEAGAEIVNDVSGLRFDESLAAVAAKYKTGLVLMHLRGEFETMHRQKPIGAILQAVTDGLIWSLEKAESYQVKKENIALDVGIGFSKTFEQNLELIAKLNLLCEKFSVFPMLVGTSRKSFLGKILSGAPAGERLPGSLGSAAIAVWNGASIVRVHDVRATVEMLKVVDRIKGEL